jgi:hypothetical protein
MVRTGTEARETYLVEHYRPGLTADELGALVARLRDAVAEMERDGKAVRCLRSTIVPSDEALLCVLEAGSEELVREAYARAGVPFERLSAVISDGDWTACMQSTSREER